MGHEDGERVFTAVLPLTLIDHPNQYFGGRAVSQSGAESLVASFVGGVPCLFHTPEGDVVLTVEELSIEAGQLVAKAVSPSPEAKDRIAACMTGDIEPAVRMDLTMTPDPVTGGLPDRIDQAVLMKVHVDLLQRH